VVNSSGTECSALAANAPGTMPPEPDRSLRVLLVEDAPLIRDAVVEMIEADGRARVAFVTDSETEALGRLGTAQFDVVIVDLQLREGSGFGILRTLQSANRGALVIVLTNHASAAVRLRCAELGAACFLDKSSEFERIPALMADWARRSESAPDRASRP
jgi:two-component system, OmpR family, response regulator